MGGWHYINLLSDPPRAGIPSPPRLKMVPVVISVALSPVLGTAAPDAAPLRLAQTIPLPEVSGRLDHLTVDLKGRRLFVAALENNTVEVIDLRLGKDVRSLKGFSKPQGVFYARDLDKLFVASGNDGTCKVVDGKTLAVVGAASLSRGADLVDYDARARQLYVGHGGKDAGRAYGELGVLDAPTGNKLLDIRTEAHPGAILVDPLRDRVFVVVPDTARILVLEAKTQAIAQNWTVSTATHPVSLALDQARQRLFVGTRTPPRILVLDTESGREVTSMPTVGTLDGLFFDAASKRLYASGGEGFIDVHRQVDADHYEPVARIPTGPTARTSLFVPQWKRLFVAVPGAADRPAEVRVYEVRP